MIADAMFCVPVVYCSFYDLGGGGFGFGGPALGCCGDGTWMHDVNDLLQLLVYYPVRMEDDGGSEMTATQETDHKRMQVRWLVRTSMS